MASSTASPTHPIPQIHLLCMDSSYSTAFKTALQAHDLSSKIPITYHDCALTFLPKDITFEAIVSPANSYGRLDGGFDDAISRFFSPRGNYIGLTRVAQAKLYEEWRGFAPPGTCTMVKIPDRFKEGEMASRNVWGTKYVALCPTMRVPEDVRWDREVVYECVWSLLNAVDKHNRTLPENGASGASKEGGDEKDEDVNIKSVLMTPLATGFGKVTAERWAEQTVLAMKHFITACEKPEKWSKLEPMEIWDAVEEVQNTHEL